jgi:signal peptidase II
MREPGLLQHDKKQTIRDVILGTLITVVVLDQLTKLVINATIGPNASRDSYWFLGDWLGFEYVRNDGVAFGLQFGNNALTIGAAVAAFLIIGAMFWRLASGTVLAALGLGLMFGGAIGNIVDRIRLGSVVDFVAVGPWPRFNIADSAITVGVLILAWCASMQTTSDEQDERSDAAKPNGQPTLER